MKVDADGDIDSDRGLDSEDEKGSDYDSDADNPEYQGLSEEEIAQLKWQKRLYKPTGPDGKGWGDFRKLNEQNLEVLQDFIKQEEKEAKRRQKQELL